LLGHTVLQPEETWDIGFIPRAEKRQHRVWGKPPAGTELVRSYPVVLVSVDFDRAGSPISYYATGNLTPRRARHMLNWSCNPTQLRESVHPCKLP